MIPTKNNSPFPSCLKPLYQGEAWCTTIHIYENEFNLHVNEISFSYEKMGTKTRFEEEAKGNSEMAYLYQRRVKTSKKLQDKKYALSFYKKYSTAVFFCSSKGIYLEKHILFSLGPSRTNAPNLFGIQG